MVGNTNSSGPLGILFTPNVDIDGNLSWTNNGELDNPPERNIKGPKGDTGRSGVDLGAYVTPTATGTIASFDDGADDLPVKSLMVDIDPAQSGSGEPSPTNFRPISGWTGAKVIRAGKNFMKPLAENQTINGVTFTLNADGTVTANGTATALTDFYYVGALNVYADAGIPTGNYLVNGGNLPASAVGSIFIIPQGSSFTAHAGGGDLAFSFDANKKYRIFYRINAGQTVNNLVISLMVRLATETNSAYEPYTANTYEITFPAEAGTVYGGTLDATNGVLTVDKTYYQFNGTETPASFAEFTTVKRATFRLSALGLPDAMAMAGVPNSGKTGLFSHGKYLTAWSGTSADVPHGYADVTNLHTYLPFENATSDSVKAYFSSQAQNGTPVQIVYSLATPITYQLTPTEVKTLLGVNNIWADTGDVSVSYRADPTIIYNKLTAAIISSGGAV